MEPQKKPRVRDLFAWKSPNRTTWQASGQAFAALGAVALLVSLILMLFQEWLAILVTWSAFFLFYALTRIPPEEVAHKITTEGIISMNHAYLWRELGPFWFTPSRTEGFTTRGAETILHVAHRNIFGQLAIIIQKEDEEKVRETLAEYLPFIELPEKSLVERLSDWFAKKFPIQNVQTAQK